MLEITILGREFWDAKTQQFLYPKDHVLRLEHSLVSLSKWESKWEKAYLHTTELTREESLDYVRCMTLNKNVDPLIYQCITNADMLVIKQYIDKKHTATTIKNPNKKKSGPGGKEFITSEVIYYWMISLQIPVEFQKWHLNRLLTLIEVCNVKNDPGKKISKDEAMKNYQAINAANKKRFKTKG